MEASTQASTADTLASSSSSSQMASAMIPTPTLSLIPPNLSLLISNLNSFVTVKLDSTNYIIWSHQFGNILRASDLIGYVTGSTVCPISTTTDSNGQIIPSEETQKWKVIDAHLLSCITATLTPQIYTSVIHLYTSHGVWYFLEKRFTSMSRSHIHQLKEKLNVITKKSKPMEEYLEQIKEIVNQLNLVYVFTDDEDIILAALKGLPAEYDVVKTTIRAQLGVLSMDQVCSLLCSEAIHIESKLKSPPTSEHNVAYTVARGNFSPGFPPRGGISPNYRGRFPNYNYRSQSSGGFRSGQFRPRPSGFPMVSGGSLMPSGGTVCQICGKSNHTALECHNRLNTRVYPGSGYSPRGFGPSQPQTAFVSSSTSGPPASSPWPAFSSEGSSNWCLDSAATNHITTDVSHLDFYQPYSGNDQVTVGNGASLPIQHTGQGHGAYYPPGF